MLNSELGVGPHMVDVLAPATVERTEPAPGMLAAQLGHGDRLHAQHVTLGPGAGIDGDSHRYPHEQLTYVVAGEPIMTIDGVDHALSAGDTLVIPGNVSHSARNETEVEAVLLDVFSPPRDDLLG